MRKLHHHHHHTTGRTTRGSRSQCQESGRTVKKGLIIFYITNRAGRVSYVGSFRMHYGQSRKRADSRPLVARSAAITSSLPRCTILQLGLWSLSQPVQYTKHGGLRGQQGKIKGTKKGQNFL